MLDFLSSIYAFLSDYYLIFGGVFFVGMLGVYRYVRSYEYRMHMGLIEEFERRWPNECIVCSMYRFGQRSGRAGRDARLIDHDCKESIG